MHTHRYTLEKVNRAKTPSNNAFRRSAKLRVKAIDEARAKSSTKLAFAWAESVDRVKLTEAEKAAHTLALSDMPHVEGTLAKLRKDPMIVRFNSTIRQMYSFKNLRKLKSGEFFTKLHQLIPQYVGEGGGGE